MNLVQFNPRQGSVYKSPVLDSDFDNYNLFLLFTTSSVDITQISRPGCTCDACDPYYCRCPTELIDGHITKTFTIGYLYNCSYIDSIEDKLSFKEVVRTRIRSDITSHLLEYNTRINQFKIDSMMPFDTNPDNLKLFMGDLLVDITGMKFSNDFRMCV